jgi:hypothetical protein
LVILANLVEMITLLPGAEIDVAAGTEDDLSAV